MSSRLPCSAIVNLSYVLSVLTYLEGGTHPDDELVKTLLRLWLELGFQSRVQSPVLPSLLWIPRFNANKDAAFGTTRGGSR
jgi:hypothetical protein